MINKFIDGKWQLVDEPADLLARAKQASAYRDSQPIMKPGTGGAGQIFNTGGSAVQPSAGMQTYAGVQAPAATAPTAVSSGGASSRIADLLAKSNSGAAPAVNPFSGQMDQYLSSQAPAQPGQAQMADNRYAGGLSQAEQRLQDLITNPAALEQSASYKFRVGQGQEALERSLGAKGLLRSGNRLTELTKYGQDMGSQEYEAENARRMALLNSYAGNYNTDQANNVNLLNVQQGSLDKQYGTAADLYKSRGTTLADLYGNANAANTARYGVDTTAATARGNTLADLYKTDILADVERERTAAGKIGDQPWWVGKYDQYGRPIG